MSFLGDFVGGAADGGAGVIANQIKTDQASAAAQANAKFENDLAIARAQTIQQMQNQNTDMLRQQGVDRVNAAAQPAINGIIASNANKVYGNGSDLTTDDMTDEEKSQFAPTPDQKNQALIQAGVQTGDIPLATMAGLQNKSELQNTKTDAYIAIQQARTDAMNAKTQAQYEAAMAKIESAVAKAGSGNTDFDKKIKLLKDNGATPQEISNFIVERKQPSLEDLANGFLKSDPNIGSPRAMKPEDAMAKAKALRQLTATANPAPAASAPVDVKNALPMPSSKDKLQAGQTYMTPRGAAVWNGTAFTN